MQLRPEQSSSVREGEESTMLRYPKVLLFSSDETEANTLQRVLGKHVNLTPVNDRAELASLLESNTYDAVFWSWSLHTGTWSEALRDVRRMRPNMPVVVLSTAPEERAWIRSLRTGAFDLLVAPLEESQLMAAFEYASGTHQAHAPLGLEPPMMEARA
jgi:DNA-binding response OmpR family regulator